MLGKVQKFEMQLRSKILMVSVTVLLIVMLAPMASAQSSSSTQFAAYNFSATWKGPPSIMGLVNESVTSVSSSTSNVTFQIESNVMNTNVSRTLNSSYSFFPYFPTIPNRTFNYKTPINNYSITAILNQTGNSSVSFNGQNYTVTNYSYSANVSQYRYKAYVLGNASVFPSGLLYSTSFNDSFGQSISVWLNSTNLSLNSTSNATMTTTSMVSSTTSSSSSSAVVVSGILAGSLFVGTGTFVLLSRRRIQKTLGDDTGGDRLMHHVD